MTELAFFKKTESGSVVNKDQEGLNAFLRQREASMLQKNNHAIVSKRIEELESKIVSIECMLSEILKKVSQ